MTYKQSKLPDVSYIPIKLKSGATVFVSNQPGGIIVFNPASNETVFAPLDELVEYISTVQPEEPEAKPEPKLRVVKDPHK